MNFISLSKNFLKKLCALFTVLTIISTIVLFINMNENKGILPILFSFILLFFVFYMILNYLYDIINKIYFDTIRQINFTIDFVLTILSFILFIVSWVILW